MYNYNFNSMSTMVRISINHELFANDLMPVYKLFTLIEETCSRFKSDSELSRINKQLGKEIKVSNELFIILNEALKFYRETDGVFNPGVLAAMKHSGYSKSIEYIRGCELNIPVNVATLSVPLTQPYELNELKRTVILYSGIDLGGIAKGWVIDKAAELLAQHGCGFVNVGGDIRLFGELLRPLNIGIEDPYDSTKMISAIQVSQGALATSATTKRRWQLNGSYKHHLIDSMTGEPSQSTIISATVTAPTAMEADVRAKVTLLLGEEQGKAWISKIGAKAVLINKSKEVWIGGE